MLQEIFGFVAAIWFWLVEWGPLARTLAWEATIIGLVFTSAMIAESASQINEVASPRISDSAWLTMAGILLLIGWFMPLLSVALTFVLLAIAIARFISAVFYRIKGIEMAHKQELEAILNIPPEEREDNVRLREQVTTLKALLAKLRKEQS